MEAYASGDRDAAADYFADDVVWWQIGSDESTQGKEAMAEVGIPEGVEFDLDIHDVVANDEHAVALVTATVRMPDAEPFSYRTAEILHVTDGKITERWAFSDDTARILDFFAQMG
jgi:ketosteroid isomerase-like protein